MEAVNYAGLRSDSNVISEPFKFERAEEIHRRESILIGAFGAPDVKVTGRDCVSIDWPGAEKVADAFLIR